ncbi:DNA-binding protein H-NS [Cribrihabitans marinus]|uniref:DNA-binding protein H-NS n=1 Tax=Cribrihabitans marinus TaxID=1227549 RepID=A0A1H7CG86_9RHOB|nr:H-NS histone family protein [Cribrihabitans marinus]GGH35466.1 nucleoid-structuring protein H-NS [Cribrihabitans marinus]SEJ88709.1 DNA-binding protein H-NS [Cribrihabitans marinus]
MGINLSSMSRTELLKLQEDVAGALKKAEAREKQEALKAAEQAAAKYGFSLSELSTDGRKSTKGTKALPKYRNPANPEQTWTGRGRKPQWLHDALKSGADISDLEI